MSEKLRIGTCEWCGEPNVQLVINDELPEWTEGVACETCEASMIEERDQQEEISYQSKLDRDDIF